MKKEGNSFFIRFLSNRERIGEEIKIKSFDAGKREGEDSIIVAAVMGKKGGKYGREILMVISNYWFGKHNDV
jgi:hypothetical protein